MSTPASEVGSVTGGTPATPNTSTGAQAVPSSSSGNTIGSWIMNALGVPSPSSALGNGVLIVIGVVLAMGALLISQRSTSIVEASGSLGKAATLGALE
jgi:hypothetical protein